MAGLTLDASMLIALGNRADAHHTWAQTIFEIYAGQPKCASVITMAEVLVHPARQGKSAAVMQVASQMGVKVLQIAENSAEPLAALRALSNLRMPDVVVLHTAINEGTALATTDHALAAAARAARIETHSPD